MKAKEKLLIAGGDLRQLYCAKKLAEKYDTAIIGFDKQYIPRDCTLKTACLEHEGLYDYAVLPVLPLDGDNIHLSAPCCETKIDISQIKPLLKTDGAAFAGRSDDKLRAVFGDISVFEYLEREELSLLNAIPTAEGAVQIAMEELPVTLSGTKVLIVGCGRIGTALIGILKGFGADVTVAVRNPKGAAKARILGAKPCFTNECGTDFGLVINTVPAMIFTRRLLESFSRSTLFIDLASKPGGIDFDAAAELGIKVVWALGLPGKTAPITSGEIIAETVEGIIAERSGTDG